MRAIKLPWKVARDIRRFITGGGPVDVDAAVRALDAAMKPRKGASPAKARRVAKKAQRRAKTSAVYEAVSKRADGQCECCGRADLPLQMDHFHGGSNRRPLESVEGCWMLCAGEHYACHEVKGRNNHRRQFLGYFLRHSASHGYDAEPQRKARAELDNLLAEGRATP